MQVALIRGVIDADGYPELAMTTFEAALAAAVGDEPQVTPVPPAPPDPTRQRCETPDGALLDPLDVLAAAVVGHVRRAVHNTASTTIDLGRASGWRL